MGTNLLPVEVEAKKARCTEATIYRMQSSPRAPPCQRESGIPSRTHVDELHLHAEVLPLQQLDDRLEVVDVLPGHPDLLVLDLGLYLEFRLLDAADDLRCVALGGRRIIKNKKSPT